MLKKNTSTLRDYTQKASFPFALFYEFVPTKDIIINIIINMITTNIMVHQPKRTISIHAPKAQKPCTKEQLGYFLAGLIDADGHIDTYGYVRIAFHEKDVSVAYYIKKILGYGSVQPVKNKAAYLFTCSHSKAILTLGNLIRNKLKHASKIEQFNTRLVPKVNCKPTESNSPVRLNNHWLAGFIQGDGSFQIKIVRRDRARSSPPSHRTEVRIVLQIDQKSDLILKQIQTVLNGSIGYRESQDTYYYSSVNFSNAFNLIKYLDKYQLMGYKLTQYWIWRKAYLQVQNQTHNTEQGRHCIIALKKTMSRIKTSRIKLAKI